MKVLVVTQYFWPEEFRVNDLVMRLKSSGHQIEVLTGIPNYPKGQIFTEYSKAPDRFTNYHGIKVHRVRHILRGTGGIFLILNYLTFAFIASLFVIFKLRKRDYQLVFAVQLSPVTAVIPAIIAARINKIKLITWVLDLWPDILGALGKLKSKFWLALIKSVSSWIYNKSDLLLITSQGFKTRMLEYGVADQKIIYFPQWIEQKLLKPGNLDPSITAEICSNFNSLKDKTKIVFTGNIGESQNFQAVVRAMSLLNPQDKIVLIVVGDGRKLEATKKLAVKLHVEHAIVFLGRFNLDYMSTVMSKADALLLPLGDDRLFELTLPGKTQTYLYAGKPIIGILNGEGAKIINDAKAGLVVPAGNAEALAKTFELFSKSSEAEREEWGRNGRKYAEEYFLPHKVTAILEDCMNQC